MTTTTTSQPLLYKDPRANILYGSGNSGITDDRIRAFIQAPGMTPEILADSVIAHGVSIDQLSKAAPTDMPGLSRESIENYFAGRGISKDLMEQPAVPKPPVNPAVTIQEARDAKVGKLPFASRPLLQQITVGPKDTVAGQLAGIMDPNNPLMVQAQTFGDQLANRRGLLNSSIAVSAGQDAMLKNAMPIATQDAATNFTAQRENVSNAKDVMLNREQMDLNKYIADLDADNKLSIANIEALSRENSIMGDLGRTMMDLYAKIGADPNIAPDVKRDLLNAVTSQSSGFISLLSSYKGADIGKLLNFGPSDVGGNGAKAGSGSGSSGSGSGSATQSKINIYNYQVEPYTIATALQYEKLTGQKIDHSKIVPMELINDLKYGAEMPDSDVARLGRFRGYVNAGLLPENMKYYSGKEYSDWFNSLFTVVHPPGTMRADAPAFYLFK